MSRGDDGSMDSISKYEALLLFLFLFLLLLLAWLFLFLQYTLRTWWVEYKSKLDGKSQLSSSAVSSDRDVMGMPDTSQQVVLYCIVLYE